MTRAIALICLVFLATSACTEGESPASDGDALSGAGDAMPGDATPADGSGDPTAGDSTYGDPALGDSAGDAPSGDGLAGDSEDPCANVGCGAPPVCGQACDAPCGCCSCGVGEGWCAFDAFTPRSVAFTCAGGCYQPQPCSPGLACNDLGGMPSCEVGFNIGGTLSGLTGDMVVGLYRNSADGLVETFSGDGTFVFSVPVADGQSYVAVIESAPAGQVCRISRAVPEQCSDFSPTLNTCGVVSAADVSDININCYPENPCEQSTSRTCFAATDGCPQIYLCEAPLSCASDGSATPNQVCCELCE